MRSPLYPYCPLYLCRNPEAPLCLSEQISGGRPAYRPGLLRATDLFLCSALYLVLYSVVPYREVEDSDEHKRHSLLAPVYGAESSQHTCHP